MDGIATRRSGASSPAVELTLCHPESRKAVPLTDGPYADKLHLGPIAEHVREDLSEAEPAVHAKDFEPGPPVDVIQEPSVPHGRIRRYSSTARREAFFRP